MLSLVVVEGGPSWVAIRRRGFDERDLEVVSLVEEVLQGG